MTDKEIYNYFVPDDYWHEAINVDEYKGVPTAFCSCGKWKGDLIDYQGHIARLTEQEQNPDISIKWMLDMLGERGDLILIQKLDSGEWHVNITYGIDKFKCYDYEVSSKSETSTLALRGAVEKLIESENN